MTVEYADYPVIRPYRLGEAHDSVRPLNTTHARHVVVEIRREQILPAIPVLLTHAAAIPQRDLLDLLDGEQLVHRGHLVDGRLRLRLFECLTRVRLRHD